MAQGQKGHSQSTGKYLKRDRQEVTRRSSLKETSTTSDSGKYYLQAVASIIAVISPKTSDSQIIEYITSASNTVKLAQERVHQAQEQLREAQDIEKAMLELAQLQEVRQAHQDLYGPDKETGLTAAQQFLAFKQRPREQQPEQ